MKNAKSKALTSRQKYDKWNNDPDYSIAGSRRRVKQSYANSSEEMPKDVHKQVYKKKPYIE